MIDIQEFETNLDLEKVLKEKKCKRIGLMGGTFDPIHYGHLVTAEAARAKFNLDLVIFIPAGNPPHKTQRKVAKVEHRLTMTLLATITNEHFTISDVEVLRDGPSYTYDTVCYFNELYKGEAELFFITGADAIIEMSTWHKFDLLMSSCKFIAATRPGYDLEGFKKANASIKNVIDQVEFLEVPALAISSTDIRERIKEGMPIKYLVPEQVETYILKFGLYKD